MADIFDEWVLEDSNRIAPFRSKTNTTNQDYLSPAPN